MRNKLQPIFQRHLAVRLRSGAPPLHYPHQRSHDAEVRIIWLQVGLAAPQTIQHKHQETTVRLKILYRPPSQLSRETKNTVMLTISDVHQLCMPLIRQADEWLQKTLVARTTQIRKRRVAPYSGQVAQAERVHQRVVHLTRLELKLALQGDNNAVVNQRLRGDTFNFYSCTVHWHWHWCTIVMSSAIKRCRRCSTTSSNSPNAVR